MLEIKIRKHVGESKYKKVQPPVQEMVGIAGCKQWRGGANIHMV